MLERNHDPEDNMMARLSILMCKLKLDSNMKEQRHRNFLKNCVGLAIPEIYNEIFSGNY